MAGPTEFTLEAVRQYMLAQPEGRVTNHELVKYFRAWLTHPTEKESARQKFKEYVNTLATIKQGRDSVLLRDPLQCYSAYPGPMLRMFLFGACYRQEGWLWFPFCPRPAHYSEENLIAT